MKLICVVGKSGSGKSTFLEVATLLGLNAYDMSSVVYEGIKKENLPMDVISVINYASFLRRKYGKHIIAELLFKKIKEDVFNNDKVVVVGGLRHIEEYEYFASEIGSSNAILVGLISDAKKRYERILNRKKESNPASYSEFLKKDEMEGKWGFDELISKCDFYIHNNSSLHSFELKIKKILSFML